jgi:hypothetical protein
VIQFARDLLELLVGTRSLAINRAAVAELNDAPELTSCSAKASCVLRTDNTPRVRDGYVSESTRGHGRARVTHR